MDKEILKKYLADASKAETLKTPKHDPKNLSITFQSYRSILTPCGADNLDAFIASDDYVARLYRNNQKPYSPIFIEIEPSPESGFSITASGVAAGSTEPHCPLDRYVVVSGNISGRHIYGEDSDSIRQKEKSRELEFVKILD